MSKNKSVLESAVKAILVRLNSTEKFVLEQAPEVIRQLVAEQAMICKMDSILCAALFPIFLFATCLAASYSYHNAGNGSDSPLFFGFVAALNAVFALVSFIGGYCSLQSLLTLKVAPKAYILRELKSLVSKEESDE